METIFNITIANYTARTPQYICEINQMDMISQLEKLPTTTYYILLAGLILLTLYIFFIHKQRDLIIAPYLLILSATFIYTFYTFEINGEEWSKIERVLWIIIIPLIIYLGYKEWRKHNARNK